MKINTNLKEIERLFERRIEKAYPSEKEFKKALLSGRKLRIYYGIDPTAPFLHLGHSANLLLLERLQSFGHEAIVLIGDFTAQIGDPSGKDKARKPLSKKEVLENCKGYKKQIRKIFKKDPVFKFNSEWWEKIGSKEFLKILSLFSAQRMLERDMFQRRQEKGMPIWLNEFVYPVLQGYDSVAMNIDVEIGGNDQMFNMLTGREAMKRFCKKDKFVVTLPLLTSKEGKKMSKSEGNVVALNEKPADMYGKVMAQPDECVERILRGCTSLTESEIKKMSRFSKRDQKAALAKEIVRIYHGEKKAQESEKEFKRVFKEKEIPLGIKEFSLKEKKLGILELLSKTKLASSNSEAKRLILQGGIKIDGVIQKDWRKVVKVRKGQIIQVGKRKFLKII